MFLSVFNTLCIYVSSKQRIINILVPIICLYSIYIFTIKLILGYYLYIIFIYICALNGHLQLGLLASVLHDGQRKLLLETLQRPIEQYGTADLDLIGYPDRLIIFVRLHK